jgi:hypothetical protein
MILPKNLPNDLINKAPDVNISNALLLCYALIKQQMYFSANKFTAIPTRLRNKIGKRETSVILKRLVDVGILDSDKISSVGNKKYWYKVVDISEMEIYKNNLLKVKKMENAHKRKIISDLFNMPKHLKFMYARLKDIKFDIDAMKEFLDEYTPSLTEYKKSKYKGTYEEYVDVKKAALEFSILELENKEYRFTRDDTGNRLHTNVTNLKSDMLRFIKESLIEIDITNSQPFFLGVFLKQLLNDTKVYNITNNITDGYEDISIEGGVTLPPKCMSKSLYYLSKSVVSTIQKPEIAFVLSSHKFKSELDKFLELTTSGKFYEYFMEEFSMERADVKILMFEILYSRNESYKKNKNVFRRVFPLIQMILEILKTDQHNTVAIILQQIESNLVVDNLCERLVMESHIIPLTKHDSIIIKEHEAEKALAVTKGIFMEKFDLVPKLAIKPL